jgi:hypothetical protein
MTTLTIFDPTKPNHISLLPSLVHIHHACILQDFTLATFLPPLDPRKTLRWWRDRVNEVTDGERAIIFAMAEALENQSQEVGADAGVGAGGMVKGKRGKKWRA